MKKFFTLFVVTMIIVLSGCQKEPKIIEYPLDPFEPEEKESADFVTFKDGIFPDSWKTYTWEITTIGFDDRFSLKSANPVAIVATTKTMNAPAYIQFYTKGENIDLYIDEEKSEALVSEEVGTWKKCIYPFDAGKHTFTWQTEGALKLLDAVSFLYAALPEVELVRDAYDITSTKAVLKGNVISHGNSPIIARGVCWSTDKNPTIENDKTTNNTGLGTFTSYLGNLTPQTTYYVRAYATNKVGTVYSEQSYFRTK
jgi:hypothetical protein